MFPRLSLRPFDCPYLFACIFGIKIVEQVTERGKTIVTFYAVYSVIDCDISNVTPDTPSSMKKRDWKSRCSPHI